ncbi:HD domain-containing protein [Pajaroellobacter abortibovis]|uniref:HD/PDEase domain-containing protein n=1 Tax=Pajaroellobacter abortibovis TaxID=1882918 RepID=A0A1L6MVB7_9BACT|nr:HD domain-containing protein [Pajaroellobacter abortibovis]APR99463.1 hypothetical protein BCY86_01285 [Pajaroellobacter abortibovis]
MILRDPVHGLVSFETDEEQVVPLLMASAEVQRLRRVRQLGLTSLAFPGAEHTRFGHAIGAAFVMKRFLTRLRSIQHVLPFWQQVTSDIARDALAAALLHDVGHGPFSHLFEGTIKSSSSHEVWTEQILLEPASEVHRLLVSLDPGMPQRVAALIRGEHPLPYLAKAVSGMMDVDRCDYLLRDAYATGVNYGSFDLDWLFQSLCFSPTADPSCAPSLAIHGTKGLPAIEAFILARLFMYQQVYFHKASRAAEWMIRSLLKRVTACLSEGGHLPQVPRAIKQAALGDAIDLTDYLELDDVALTFAMHAWEAVSDPVLSDLAQRIRHRRLFKTLELFGEHAKQENCDRLLQIGKEIAKAGGFDPDFYIGLDVASHVAFSTKQDPLLVVYAKGPARSLDHVSFLLGRLANQQLARIRLIFAPELREDIVAAIGCEVGEEQSSCAASFSS